MKRAFKILCVFMTLLLIVSSVAMVFAVTKTGESPEFDAFSSKDLVDKIENMEMNMTSVIYVKNEKGEWTEYQRIHGDENRIWVDIEKMPKNLINAFVAIEDQRYYKHGGVDWKRTIAAFVDWLPHVNILSGDQGGSSITQQLIKNLTSDSEKDASRKFREIIRALSIEKIIDDKEVILEAYLNTINLGGRNCGVQVAANYYFNKDVDDLTLAECACLAAITKNPSKYKPDIKPEENAERRRTVLNQMLDQKMITYEEYSEAYDQEIVIDKSQQSQFEIPINSYFVETLIQNVTEDLAEKYNCSLDVAATKLYNGGYKIYASLDQRIQNIIDSVYLNEKKYFSQKAKDKTKHVESAITIMDYQGHIVGIAGGTGQKTVNKGLNRAYNIPRQPGSTMKPIGVYTPAMDAGIITPYSIIVDQPLDNYYPDGKKGPKEWYGYYAGSMTLSKALERSANTIPCHVLKGMGVDYSYDFLTKKLQMKHLTDTDKNLSALALGGCVYGITPTESAAAYAIFGNGGVYYEPVTYHKVTNGNGDVILNSALGGQQVIKPETATIMNGLLQNVVYGSQGTGTGIRSFSSMKAFAKTGTSSESNDLWMVAGSPYYVASVWYGFDKPQQIYNQAAAATVWKAVMTEVHKGLEKKTFTTAENFVNAKYCKKTGLLAGKKCYSTANGNFVPGVEIATCSGKHSSVPSSSTPSSSSTPPASTTPTPPPTSTTTPSTPSLAPSSSVQPTTPSTPPAEDPKPEESKPQGTGSD